MDNKNNKADQKSRMKGLSSRNESHTGDEDENKVCKRPRMETEIIKNSLENFLNNPGLRHLAEDIYSCLGYNNLDTCQLVNSSCPRNLRHFGNGQKKMRAHFSSSNHFFRTILV